MANVFALEPGIAPDGNHGALIGWSQGSAVRDVYGQRILGDGTLPAPPRGVETPRESGLGLRALSNPAAERIEASVSLPRSGRATLTLLDVTGRSVASRVLDLTMGEHRVLLGAARTHAPGLYFLRLQTGGSSKTVRLSIAR